MKNQSKTKGKTIKIIENQQKFNKVNTKSMKINKNEWNIWIGMGPANDFYRFFMIFDAFH